jgi:GNAT superfamily N-acetyltransferase
MQIVDGSGGQGPGIVVRRAMPDDLPALALLRWRWVVEEHSARTEIAKQSFVDFFTAWALDHLNRYVPFVAEVDGQLAGMAWLSLTDRVPSPRALDRRAGDLQCVYIVPGLRGRGVGARLIGAAIQHARDLELRHLTVHSATGAIGFYGKLGFLDDEQWMALPDDRLASVAEWRDIGLPGT